MAAPEAKPVPARPSPFPAPWGRKITGVTLAHTATIGGSSITQLAVGRPVGTLGNVEEMTELPHGVEVVAKNGRFVVSWGVGVVGTYAVEK